MDIKQRYNYADAIVEDWMKPDLKMRQSRFQSYIWTENDSEILRKAWNAGNMSANQIAKKIFQGKISALSICSRARTMGLAKKGGYRWTKEDDAALIEAWEAGNMTASKIAEITFKGKVSEGAVIGRAKRIGLKKINMGRPRAKTIRRKLQTANTKPYGAGYLWTKENDAILREAWEAGNMTASEIAKITFKGKVGRGAVIGRANRMGLTKKRRGYQTPRARAKTIRRKLRITQIPKIGKILPTVRFKSKEEAPKIKGTPLLILENYQCVFPVADATAEVPMLFCGYKRWNKSPYCKYHHDLSYIPLPQKKKHANFRLPK